MHHLLVDTLDATLGTLAIEGEQARHAVRVRRMNPGEPVILMDGAGRTAEAAVEGSDKNGPENSWRLLVRITTVLEHPPLAPAIHVLCPAPKGDLLETMIDQLSQIGAASWRPLDSDRSEREPRAGKIDRLLRIAHESAKQCGRPWFLEIGEPVAFDNALRLPGAVLADAAGVSPTRVFTDAEPGQWDRGIHVLVGPEGGFSDDERSKARHAGLATVALGPHVLRIGTAAVVAASGFVAAGRG
jgi:16S rRNA (uracil1498-N3)-methyltransferase